MSAKRLRVLAVGCTPLAAKTIAVVEELSSCELAGVVNLHPEEGRLKSNYDSFSDWAAKNPERMHWTSDINSEATRARDRPPALRGLKPAGGGVRNNSKERPPPGRVCPRWPSPPRPSPRAAAGPSSTGGSSKAAGPGA